ncbi:MAG: hypothetical protein ACTSYI_03750 [Promethearchaeota archaeon]
MTEVCIYTHNAKLFYLITKKFRSEGILFVALDEPWHIHRDGRVLITTPQDINRFPELLSLNIPLLIISPEQETPEQILVITLQFLRSMQYFSTLTIAIDPGTKLTGIALFLDGIFIYSREILNFYQLKKFLQSMFEIFPKHRTIIKIGNGVMKLTRKFIEHIRNYEIKESNVECMIINESFTTRKYHLGNRKTESKHERAAMIIGRRSGELVFFK